MLRGLALSVGARQPRDLSIDAAGMSTLPPPACRSKDDVPRFVYGNQAALDLFECTWDELVGIPSTQVSALCSC